MSKHLKKCSRHLAAQQSPPTNTFSCPSGCGYQATAPGNLARHTHHCKAFQGMVEAGVIDPTSKISRPIVMENSDKLGSKSQSEPITAVLCNTVTVPPSDSTVARYSYVDVHPTQASVSEHKPLPGPTEPTEHIVVESGPNVGPSGEGGGGDRAITLQTLMPPPLNLQQAYVHTQLPGHLANSHHGNQAPGEGSYGASSDGAAVKYQYAYF